jgi:tripartite-type tricarboxylate transporter receptor subunit TctC
MGRLLVIALFAASCIAAPSARADYPAKPVRLVVGLPAGATADALSRILAQGLTVRLGQPVIVENRPGADSALAAEFVARAAPDGYTILFASSGNLAAVPALRSDLRYDPVRDFTALSRIGYATQLLFVHAAVPVRTLDELISYARARPDELNYATGNPAAAVAMAQFIRATGIRLHHVPYKGEAPALPDLVAGRVQLQILASVSQALPLVQEGRLRVLAAVLDRRSPVAPDVPTFAEAGVPEVSARLWSGLVGPRHLARDITELLSREINAVLKSSEVREQLARLAYDPQPSTPEEFAAYIESQVALWKRMIKEGGITAQ